MKATATATTTSSEEGNSSFPSLPPFLDPPFEVFATDLAVDMALAWIAELAAWSSAASDAEVDDDDDDEEEEGGERDERRRWRSSGGSGRCSSSSPSSSSRPLAGLPASALSSLTEDARRDILGAGTGGASEGGGDANNGEALRAWRRAYPAALASALLSGDNKSSSSSSSGKSVDDENGKSGDGGKTTTTSTSSIKGQVITRVQYGERVRLRGGTVCAVATPAGGDSPGGAIWTLVDAVAENAASLPGCSGRGFGKEKGGRGEETGVARVVCVGSVGTSSSSSSSAAAPLDVAALRGAHVLVLAPPEDPPPRKKRFPPVLLKKENDNAAAPPPSSSSSSFPSLFAAAAAAAVAAVERGGNALLPISAGDGRALELAECVLSALYARGGLAFLSRVPCYFASRGARRAMAASCSSAEWLCAARSALVLSGRAPYFAGPAASAAASVVGGGGSGGGNEQQHASANRQGSGGGGGGLFVADSLSEARRCHGWREPCVALVPASSLFNSSGGGGGGGGGGDGAALLRAWGGDPRSALIFTRSSSSSSPLPSGARLSQLVARAHPGIRARVVDVDVEAEAEATRNAGAAAAAAAAAPAALSSLVAAVAPRVLVVPRAWERAMLDDAGPSDIPLGKACGRVEALDPLLPLELAEGEEEEEDDDDGDDVGGENERVLPRALSRAGVTSELASAAAKVVGSESRSVLLALATVRDGGIELDAPPGAAGGAALAAALVVGGATKRQKQKKRRKTTAGELAAPASSTLDALLCELGAPAVKVE